MIAAKRLCKIQQQQQRHIAPSECLARVFNIHSTYPHKRVMCAYNEKCCVLEHDNACQHRFIRCSIIFSTSFRTHTHTYTYIYITFFVVSAAYRCSCPCTDGSMGERTSNNVYLFIYFCSVVVLHHLRIILFDCCCFFLLKPFSPKML